MATTEPPTRGLPALAGDLSPEDPSWPPGLADLDDAVPRLRVAGRLPFLDRAVAIVGTRRATPDGLGLAREVSRSLAGHGWVIVSGGAEGIDAAAHEGALEGGWATVAVLAGGLGRPFPRQHAPLFERIAAGGAVLSEVDDDEAPQPHRFLSRNRIIAALSRAVLVVQAPARSGALSTAAHARRLGRPVFAVPWAVGDLHGAGGNSLLAARTAWACRGADDLVQALTGGRLSVVAPARRARPRLDPDARAVFACVDARGVHPDAIAHQTGLPASKVKAALTTLTLLGLIAPDLLGRHHRTR